MNIAYLILAHHQPSHLARLIKALSCDSAYFFVHVDLKTDISPFKELVFASPKIIFLDSSARANIYWGGFNMVMATLALLQAAIGSGVHFARYCLLSGSDFPIKKNSRIEEAFSTDTEFLRVDRKLDYEKNDSHSQTVKYLHLYDNCLLNPKTTPSKKLFAITRRIVRKIPRKRYQKFHLYQGAQWWSLTDQCVRYIFKFLDENSDYMAFHKYTSVPDETFFHSIIKNSPFAESIINDYEKVTALDKYFTSNEHGCHYIDWNTKGVTLPKVLDSSDMELLMRSTALFARKFDENRSDALLRHLEDTILFDS